MSGLQEAVFIYIFILLRSIDRVGLAVSEDRICLENVFFL